MASVLDRNLLVLVLSFAPRNAGLRASLSCHSFLQATIAGKSNHLVIKNYMLSSVKMGGGHLGSDRHTHGITHSLAKRTGGALDPSGFSILGVTGCLTVELAEILYLFEREVIPGKMQPSIKEHTAMTGRENETVAIKPLVVRRIDLQVFAEQNGSYLGGSERESQMP